MFVMEQLWTVVSIANLDYFQLQSQALKHYRKTLCITKYTFFNFYQHYNSTSKSSDAENLIISTPNFKISTKGSAIFDFFQCSHLVSMLSKQRQKPILFSY